MKRKDWAKRLRYCLLGILSLSLVLTLGCLLPTKWQYQAQRDCTYPIYVSNVQNFHAELIVPVTNAAFDWRSHLNLSQLGPNADTYRYLSFGWGDRAFFMDNSHDLKTVFAALFLPTPTVMHVWGHSDLKELHPPTFELKQVNLTRKNYLALMSFISQGFQQNVHHQVQYLKKGLYPESGFYEAVGSYSLLQTCNTWTADALRTANVNTPVWAVLAPPILYHLKSDCSTAKVVSQ
jgi:uncharacterized protein (TIGR02117 family)